MTASRLERRANQIVVATLLGLAGVAWVLTVRQAFDMSSMITGLGQVGSRMPNDMAAPLFMAMWLTMMVAMMFPTIAPMVLAHRMVVTKRGEGALPTVAFVLGYLVVWTVIGLVPLAVVLASHNLQMEMDRPAWVPFVAGAVLVVAGVYQITPLKGICLNACRTPMGFVLTHDFGTGAPGAFKAGAQHGAYCLGCCWPLMAVLVVVGLMNLVWMAGIALVFVLEKNWRYGVALSRVAGTLIALLGLAVIARPDLLTIVSNGYPRS
jgi:predicted metal-binding membrane protein